MKNPSLLVKLGIFVYGVARKKSLKISENLFGNRRVVSEEVFALNAVYSNFLIN